MRFKVKKAGRSAPAAGYDTPRKRHYRRQVWNVLGEVPAIYDCSPADTEIMLMPALEGDEIDVALSHGFREDRMHVVDWNPAVVATLKRTRYPRITGYGVDAARACERIAKAGIRLGCVNLDFCGNLARPVAEQVSGIVNSGALGGIAVIGVTLLRGREGARVFGRLAEDVPTLAASGNSPWAHEIAALSPLDLSRLRVVLRLLSGETFEEIIAGPQTFKKYLTSTRWTYISRAGVYRSEAGTQTMLWAVLGSHEAPCLCSSCFHGVALMMAPAVHQHGGRGLPHPAYVLEAIATARGIPMGSYGPGKRGAVFTPPFFPARQLTGRWDDHLQHGLEGIGVKVAEIQDAV